MAARPLPLCDLNDAALHLLFEGQDGFIVFCDRNAVFGAAGRLGGVPNWGYFCIAPRKRMVRVRGMSVARRQPPPGVTHHSDRGYQYGGLLVGGTLRDAGIIPSMGRVGDPRDNPLMESAIGAIKAALVNRHIFQTRDQAASPCSTASRPPTTPTAP
jgi:hypothetical protein